jgi:para-nitrobenzyl esterase
MWARATYRQHQQLARYVPVYAYEFADQQAPSDLPFPEELPPGAFHSAEVDYLFATHPFEARLTPAQRQLSEQMIRYWTNFARKGNPNGKGLPVWQPFRNSEAVPFVQTLAPDTSGRSATDYLKVHQLDFWNRMP